MLEDTPDGKYKRAVSGDCIKRLEGHHALVDRCCVFSNGTRMISASWDKTCKIWDLESGKCLHTCKDENKVRGVAVYDNDKRAVCCGSGTWLSIWDIGTGLLVNRVDMKHTSTVWGLQLLDHLVPLPARDGVWALTHVAMTYSGDGFVKMWDLSPENEHEIVHARRACDPGPMCVAAVPPSFELGGLPLLVGGFRSIKMYDVSSIGTGPSAGAIWAGRGCVDPGAWSDWLMDTVRETSPHFLYARDRDSQDLPTLIHKLADSQVGYSVLDKLLLEYTKQRAIITSGKPYVKEEHGKALGTIGMLSRAGTSDRGSALAIAVEGSYEDMAQLLLEDYQSHIASYAYIAAGYAPATIVMELTEADIVHLFGSFPVLAAEFLERLPMQATDLVAPESKCDFSAALDGKFIRASESHSPPVERTASGKFTRYWDPFIDKQWRHSDSKQKTERQQATKLNSHELRPLDTAWGVKLKAERVPLIAGGFIELEQRTKVKKKKKGEENEDSDESQEGDHILEEATGLTSPGPTGVFCMLPASMLLHLLPCALPASTNPEIGDIGHSKAPLSEP